jgi:LmbE family N-acetylglucosaminyl deacetylase
MATRKPTASRREVLAGLAAGAVAVGLPLVSVQAAEKEQPRKLKVIVVGAHPDDPESTTGGTIARYTDLGYEVGCLYLTRGEAGKRAETPEKAAALRTAEAEKSCKILKARPLFAGQIDAETEINPKRYGEFFKLLDAEKPNLVFTHWPIDPHRDHRAASLLVYDAWLQSGKKFALFYFEVHGGAYLKLFRPTHYVDITATEERKRQACLVHGSGPRIYEHYHDLMNRFRGLEIGCKFAEAFIEQPGSQAGRLL